MAHQCVDWTVSPPVRKTPLLILSCGDAHVYATVPEKLDILEDVARKEFDLGDAELEFYSSCANLCSDVPARIGRTVWEHIRPFIGCISVKVKNAPLKLASGHYDSKSGAKDDVHARIPHPPPKFNDESRHDDSGEDSKAASRRMRHRRHALPDNEDDDDTEGTEETEERIDRDGQNAGAGYEREHFKTESSSPPAAPLSSPPSSQSSLLRSLLSPIHKKEFSFDDHTTQSHTTSDDTPHRPSKRMKQDEQDGQPRLPAVSYERSSQELHYQLQSNEPSEESQRLVIRIAHRASKQESKFTTKSSTKVSKVISAACKSFGLDAKRATLYLLVDVEDEGGVTENFFPCHRDDTMARAGAEDDTESRFLLTIAGDP